jgi:acetylornithine/N-succinyldiaminopimelate aminotransferase
MASAVDVPGLLARLAAARTALAAQPLVERVATLGRVAELWLEDRDRLERAAAEIGASTGYAAAMVATCLRRTFAAHRTEALLDLMSEVFDRVGDGPREGIRRFATPPRLVVAVLAQNTPGLAIAPAFQALALGSPILLKPASREPHFAERLVRSIAEVDTALGAACAAVAWKGRSSGVEADLLGAAGRIVAYGGGATITALRERFGERVVACGPRVSVAVVARPGEDLARVAEALARDVAFLDQRGCLSPQVVWVAERIDRQRLGEAVATALRELEREWPRRRLDLADAAAFRRAADAAEAEALAGRVLAFHGGGAEPFGVVVEREPHLRSGPLDRFVRLHPFRGPAGLREALAPLEGVLECVGLDADDSERAGLEDACRERGATRLCPLGSMQDPPAAWHAGGRLPLAALVQWSTVEAASLPDPASGAAPERRGRFLRYVAQTSATPRGIEVRSARGSSVFDTAGNAYLDLLAGLGVAALGHAHPDVTAAVKRQAERYAHVMVYGEDVLAPQVDLAERLASLLPDRLSCTYLTSSGAEAIEGALKLVRKATGRSHVLAFEGAYHGDTTGALALGGNPFYREPFRPLLGPIEHLPWNDPATLARIDGDTAGVFVEPVQAEAGVRIPDASFLPALAARCREVGALLVYDEVVTGLGRTGRWFALEHWPGAEPDVLVLAKSLGGGLPLGAFVSSPALMRVLAHEPPLGHITTFGGNPVACAAALATLDVLERERLPARAAELGARLREQLGERVGTGSLVGVRGLGLLIGLELDSPAATRRFVQQCFERRLLVGWTLHDDALVRIAPPLNITDAEVETALARLTASL